MRKITILVFLLFFALSGYARDESFRSLEGASLSYEELVGRPKTIFFLWTTWCPYCRQELDRLARECTFFEDIEIFFVNVGEKKATVQRFSESRGYKSCIRQRIILDDTSFIADKFSVVGIPTFIFLKNGSFIYKSYFLDQELLEKLF
jgi:thiol-disulfide isomerase/thioredoxin